MALTTRLLLFSTPVAAILLMTLSPWTGARAQPAGTEERFKAPLSFKFTAGAEYDSNVSVDAIDTNTGQEDFAAVFDADISFESEIANDTELSLGYNFSQSLHDEFANFDIQSHLVSADISHDFEAFDAGAAYRLAYSRLGGDAFLTMQQISPYISAFYTEKFFFRGAYTYSDKNFANRVDRDSDAHAGSIDIYYFLNGIRTFFIVGYQYESEDTNDPQFDFNAHQVKARWLHRIPMGKRDAQLKLGWRYETRDYSSITPSIGVARDDNRHRLEAELEIPVTDRIFGLIEYEYSDFSSNLPSADYTQNLAAVRLGLQF